jgi:hypothetical protein
MKCQHFQVLTSFMAKKNHLKLSDTIKCSQSTQTNNCIDEVSDQLFVGLTLQVGFALKNHNILKEHQL